MFLVPRQQSTASTLNTDPAWIAEDNSANILIIAGLLSALALIFMGMRIWVRFWIMKVPGVDDYALIAAMAFTVVNFICFVGKKPYGMGRHYDTITPPVMKNYKKWQFYQSQSFVLAVGLVKISIAVMLMRLTGTAVSKRYKRFLIASIIFMVCFTLACLGTLIFLCWPVAGYWDPSVKARGYCYPQYQFKRVGLMNTCINVITNFMYATLPIPLIWKLQMNYRSKIAIISTLGLGYFACGASIVKGVMQGRNLQNQDQTYWEEVQLWGLVQACVSIICACIPTLRPLFRTLMESTLGYHSRSPSSGYPQSKSRSRRSYSRSGAIELSSIGRPKPSESDQELYNVSIHGGEHVGKPGARVDMAERHGDGDSSRSSQEILPKDGTIGSGYSQGITKRTEVVVKTEDRV